MRNTAIILAAGSSHRFSGDEVKQFAIINGKYMLAHSMRAFFEFDHEIEIVLVLPEKRIKDWKKMKESMHLNIDHKCVAGGKSRSESVKNALDNLEGNGLVFIHDAARPCIAAADISLLYEAALKKGNAVPFLPCSDSMRLKEGREVKVLERKNIFQLQTPQVFKLEEVKDAYAKHQLAESTDDSEIVEKMGVQINYVPGSVKNIKVTYPFEIQVAGLILTVFND